MRFRCRPRVEGCVDDLLVRQDGLLPVGAADALVFGEVNADLLVHYVLERHALADVDRAVDGYGPVGLQLVDVLLDADADLCDSGVREHVKKERRRGHAEQLDEQRLVAGGQLQQADAAGVRAFAEDRLPLDVEAHHVVRVQPEPCVHVICIAGHADAQMHLAEPGAEFQADGLCAWIFHWILRMHRLLSRRRVGETMERLVKTIIVSNCKPKLFRDGMWR